MSANAKKKTSWRPSFGGIMAGVVVLAMSLGLLINYVSLNEVSSALRKSKKTYEELVTESQIISQQLDTKISNEEIIRRAEEDLGMQKMESYQIQYVNLIEQDSIYLAKNEAEDDRAGLLDGIVASFNILVEYLR